MKYILIKLSNLYNLFLNSTTENLTVFVWNSLQNKLNDLDKDEYDCALHEVKIFETEKNICIYRGEKVNL